MATNPNTLLNVVEAVSTAVSRLLPVVEQIPDSMGKWVPPIKAAVAVHQRFTAQIGLASGAAKALRGRFGLVDAAMAALNLRTLGASRKMSALGAIGATAFAKVARTIKDSRREAERLASATQTADTRLAKLGRTGEKANRNAAGAGGGVGKLIAAVGAYRLLGEAADQFKGAFDLGGQLSDQAAKTGIAAEQLLVLGQAGKDAGVEDITGSITKMQGALVDAAQSGAGPAAQALGMLGLKTRDLIKQNPVDQFQAIGAALQNIEAPELRTAISKDLFGRSGPELLALLTDSSNPLATAQKSLGRQAVLLGQNSARFDSVSDRLGRAGLKMQGFFVGLASTTLPLMEAVTQRLDGLDLASQGERFGEALRVAVNVLVGALADPASLTDPLSAGLKAAFLGAGNVLIAVVGAVGKNFGTLFSSFSGVFKALGKIIGGTLLKAFSGPMDYLVAAITSAFENAKADFAKLRDQLTPGGSAEGNAAREAQDNYLMMKNRRVAQLQASGDVGDFGQAITARGQEQLALLAQMKAPSTVFDARTTAQVMADNANLSQDVGGTMLDTGKAQLKTELDDLFGAIGDTFRDLRVTDVLGAQQELEKAAAGFRGIAAKGAEIVDSFIGPAESAPVTKANPFAAFATASKGGLLRNGGLVGASFGSSLGASSASDAFTGGRPFDFSRVANLATARSTTPILSVAERRAFADARVSAGGTREASSSGAFSAIAKGDAARRRNLEKERERERMKNENSVARSNQLLGGIFDYSRRTAEALE